MNPKRFQEEHNNGQDYTDPDVLYNDWVAYGEGDSKPELIHRMVYESGEVLDWLNYDHGYKVSEPSTGFTPSDVYVTKYQWLPNDIMYNKDVLGQYFDGLWSDFKELGGTYMLETEGYALIYDEKSNAVTGARARNMVDGTEYVINAKAVNHYCETGVDEEFGKDKSLLDPIGDGPYYGVIMASYCYGTVGGLDINESFEVIQADGKTPIEGLYAVGNESIGVLFTEKKAYVTYGGANNGWGWTSGYLCGEGAAKKLGFEKK